MFPLVMKNINLCQSYVHDVSSKNETWLWNRRYGHLSFKTLNNLQKKSMIYGLPIIDVQHNPCEGCIIAKDQRDNFPYSGTLRA